MEEVHSKTILDKIEEFNSMIDNVLNRTLKESKPLLKFLMVELKHVPYKSRLYQGKFKQAVERYSSITGFDSNTIDGLLNYLKVTRNIGNKNELPLTAELAGLAPCCERLRYEVYSAFVDDKCIYIGAGDLGRHEHCDSGVSHNYGLNHAHFCRNKMKVIVVREFERKFDAFYAERQLIARYKPECNVDLIQLEPAFAT